MTVIQMNAEYAVVRPAALSRQLLSLTGRLETLATATQTCAHQTAGQRGLEPPPQPEVIQ